MSSNNNDDKSEKNNININAENSQFKSDFFEKQNIKTQKNKLNTKKAQSFQQKDKDSIFSGSSNENENNNSSEENNKEQNNNNNNSASKEIIDINDPEEKISPNKDINNNLDNNKFNNNLMSINNNDRNQKENEDNPNVSRSMSSKSNLSRSRSRSQSEKNSHSDEQNKNLEGQNQEKNSNKNLGNKFKNYKNSRRQRNSSNNLNNNNNSTFIMKNGCCRNCMKAFSKNGKSCLCQVPRRERKFILPENGCNYCGCHGCNPIDMKYNKRLQQKDLLFQDSSINHKNQRILDSEDEDLKVKDNLVDYYNRDKKDIHENLSDMLKIDSIFYGFGVPLRIPSYILGYNPNVNYYYEKKNLGNNNYMDYNNNMGGNMNNNMGNNMNNNMGNNMNNYNNYELNMNNNNRFRRNNNNYGNNNNNFNSYGNNFGNNNFQNNMNNNMNFNRNQRFRK